MDGYGYGYPPGSTPDYSSPPMQRPASQTNAPSPHPGRSGGFAFLVTYLVLEHVCGVRALLRMPWRGLDGVACENGMHIPPQYNVTVISYWYRSQLIPLHILSSVHLAMDSSKFSPDV